jgi:cytochrome c-type biogenesis protein CcmH/NrfG
MTDTNKTDQWTSIQAYTLAVVCLLIGIAGGWLIRGSQAPSATGPVESAKTSAPAATGGQPTPSPAQLKQMADTQAAPLLEKLKSDANDASLLTEIGNVYYDTQQYPIAIDYYGRALKITPENTSVRTDLGTAMWYLGNADGAIDQFNQALKVEPNKANALFNLGIVKWQGKMDVDGAVAAWQKLLATNPNYEAKDKVEQLIAQAKKHSNVKPGTPAKPLPQ